MLLQRLATGATGVKQARYRRDTGEGLHGAARHSTRMRSIIHSLLAIDGPWHLLFNAWCNACI